MAPKNRSKSESFYSPSSEHFIHTKSKQLLYHKANVCTLGRTILKPSDGQFSETTATSLLPKHLKKRKSHGIVYCLVDRLRFDKRKSLGSKSYRSDLCYREIKYFFEHLNQPDCFTLAVELDNNGTRAYESYKCKQFEDVQILREIIYNALSNNLFLVNEENQNYEYGSDTNENYHKLNQNYSKLNSYNNNNNKNRQSDYVKNEPIYTQPVKVKKVNKCKSYKDNNAEQQILYDNQIGDHLPVYMYFSRSSENRPHNVASSTIS